MIKSRLFKSFSLIALMGLAIGCGGSGNDTSDIVSTPSTSTETPVEEGLLVKYTFESITETRNTAFNDEGLLAALEADKDGVDLIDSVTDVTRIYPGNSANSGAFPLAAQLLKTGTTDNPGGFILNTKDNYAIEKVTLMTHSWFKVNPEFPDTMPDKIVINGVEKEASMSGDMELVEFEFAATGSVEFVFNKRVYISEIKLFGYKGDAPAPIPAKSVTIAAVANAQIEIAATIELNATVLPANSTDVVEWESENDAIATVNEAGVVTGVSEGNVKIIAKAGNKSDDIQIEVLSSIVLPTVVTINQKNDENPLPLTIGKELTLTATVGPEGVSNENVIWESADATKATISNDGVVKGIAAGEVVITAKAAGKTEITDTVTISVEYTRVDIEDIRAEKIAGIGYNVEAVVVAYGSGCFFVQDDTGIIEVQGAMSGFDVGDKVSFKRKTGIYSNAVRLASAPNPSLDEVVDEDVVVDLNATVWSETDYTAFAATAATDINAKLGGAYYLEGTMQIEGSSYSFLVGETTIPLTVSSSYTTGLAGMNNRAGTITVIPYGKYNENVYISFVSFVANTLDESAAIEAAFDALKLSDDDASPTEIAMNLALPLIAGDEGELTISWASDNEAININNTTGRGVVTRPAADASDEAVKLTATITGTGEGANKDFYVKVLKEIPVEDQQVVINQFYPAGGNQGAIYKEKFVELYNQTNSPVDLSNWSLQYFAPIPADSSNISSANLSGSIAAKSYLRIKVGASSAGADTPSELAANLTVTAISPGGTNGNIALMSTQTKLTNAEIFLDSTENGRATIRESLTANANMVDLLGYGTGVCWNSNGTGAAPAPSAQNAIFRTNFINTNNSQIDFTTGAPILRIASTEVLYYV